MEEFMIIRILHSKLVIKENNVKFLSATEAVRKYPHLTPSIVKYYKNAKKLLKLYRDVECSKADKDFMICSLQNAFINENTGKITLLNEPQFDRVELENCIKEIEESEKGYWKDTTYRLGNKDLVVSEKKRFLHDHQKWEFDTTIKFNNKILEQKLFLVDEKGEECPPVEEKGYMANLLKNNKVDLIDLKITSLEKQYQKQQKSKKEEKIKGE